MTHWLLPEGISDVLPHEARRIEDMRRALLDLYRGYGYELVIPPLIEYVESLLIDQAPDLDLRTFKLVDQASGRLMGVRPDTTPQAARIDAHLLNRNGVVRLCYAGSVLHARPRHALAVREPFQVGAELYGHVGPAADIEIVELAVLSLRVTGMAGIHLDLGHPGVLRALLAQDPPARPAEEAIVAALNAKDQRALHEASAGLGDATRAALGALLRLQGDAAVLADARRLLPASAAVAAALDALERVAEACPADRVSIDLADLLGYRYHTGVSFVAYVAGLTDAVLRGGRYDDIGRSFGRSRPATGFSIDLRDLSRLPGGSGEAAILAPAQDDASLNAFVRALRAQGEVVVRQLEGDAAPDGRDFDREIRRRGDGWAVVARHS
ncbi:MAG TPA: ATP phosphoribosyltransferase regulatory subunit [Burkholderiaceae bacterium]|nr:ATP phosphoribosyltransferase regulatory subunit [Burkholderiaceae bacterium]